MPTVPRLDRPQVRSTPEPSRLEAVNPLQAVGQGVQQVAQAGAMFAKEVQRLDEIRVNEALESFALRADSALNDPEEGVFSKRGMKAGEALDPFRDRLTVARGDVEATLGNERQKALFQAQSERTFRTAGQRAFQHIRGEMDRVDAQSTDARTRRDLDAVATASRAGAMDEADATITELANRIALYHDRRGLDKEAIASLRFEAVSNARLVQVTALANAGDPERASDVLRDASMTEKDRQQGQDVVKESDLRVRAQREEDRILATHPEDEAAALAAARTLDGELRDQVVQRVRARFAEAEQIQNRTDARTLETVLGEVERAGDLSRATPSQIATLRRKGWYDNVQSRAAQVRNGNPPVTEMNALEEIYAAGRNGTLKDIVPLTYRSRLNDRDYRMLLESVEAAKTGGDGKQNPAITQEQVDRYTFDGARRLGLLDATLPSDLKGDKAEAFEELRREVANEMDREREKQGRNLSASELEAVVKNALYGRVMFNRGSVEPQAARFSATPPPAPPPLRPGLTRADREARAQELIRAGWSSEAAVAQVLREIP